MLSVGMIIGGAFRLIRERPGSVLVWGVIYSLTAFALGYVWMSAMAPMNAMGPHPDPGAALGAVGSLLGRILLGELVVLCVYTILQTAALRAVLRPDEGGLASIRLGGDEARMIGLAIFLGFLFVLGYAVATIILGMLAAAVGMAAGAPAAMAPVMVVGLLLILGLLLFFWVRVSLAFPLTLMRGRFALGEGWRLSRGHFWTLFGGYITLVLIIVALVAVTSLVLQSGYWSQLLARGVTGPEAQRAAQAQMAAQYSLGLPMLLTLLVGLVIGGLGIAFTGGAVATAARALATDQDGVAEAFA
jgi:hypothetical protein